MRRFVRHDGASRDSQRKMMDTYGGAVLKQEQELTRNGYNRTALGQHKALDAEVELMWGCC